MPEKDYIIIGRDVGEAKYHLVGDNIIAADKNPGGTPLDVIYLGKLIGDMSERRGDDRKATEKEAEMMRHCLRADTVPGGNLKKAEAELIIDNTTVEVMFETRAVGDCIHEDTNTRIIVVPADGTLKSGLEQLEMPVVGKPFQPPLTYPVDENLMLSWMLDGIIEKIVGVASPDDPEKMSWDQIRKHFADTIEAELITQADEDKISQIAAFHRAVGIYMSNMCR